MQFDSGTSANLAADLMMGVARYRHRVFVEMSAGRCRRGNRTGTRSVRPGTYIVARVIDEVRDRPAATGFKAIFAQGFRS